MNELHFCLNCQVTGFLSVHGRCQSCHSEAVISTHAQNFACELQASASAKFQEISELNRIFELK